MSEFDSSQFAKKMEHKNGSELAILKTDIPVADTLQGDDRTKVNQATDQLNEFLATVPLQQRIGELAAATDDWYSLPDEGEFLTVLQGSDGTVYPIIRRKSWFSRGWHIDNNVIDPMAWDEVKKTRVESNTALVTRALRALDKKIGVMAEKGTIAKERIERLLEPFKSVDEAIAAGWTLSPYSVHTREGEHEELDYWGISELETLFNPDHDSDNDERDKLIQKVEAAIIAAAKPEAVIVAPENELSDSLIYPFVDKNGETFILSGTNYFETSEESTEEQNDTANRTSDDPTEDEDMERDTVTEYSPASLRYCEGEVMKSVMKRAREDKTEGLQQNRAAIAEAYTTATKILDEVSELLHRPNENLSVT